jgi:hypothetical protein
MMWGREDLAFVSAALTAACVIPYLRDVVRGTTQPQRMSWFVFALLAVVAAISQALVDAGPGMWLAAGSAVGFTAVFVASIRRGVGGTSLLDIGALVITVVGVIVGVVVELPLVAVAAVILAEIAAVTLTFRKALRDPDSETRSTWVIDCVAGIVAVAAVPYVSFAVLLYPIHHTLANAAIVVAIGIGRRRAARLRAAEAALVHD